MQKKRIFTWLTLMSAVVCLAAFAWANSTPTADTGTSVTVTTADELRRAVANQASGDTIIIAENIKITGVNSSNDMEARGIIVPRGR